MRAPSRKQLLYSAVALVLGAAFAFSSLPVQSLSTGIDATSVGIGPQRGCYCHSPDGASKAPNGNATIVFVVNGVEGGYYQAQKTYSVNLSFSDPGVPMNPNATANHGGFNVWASAGVFKSADNHTIVQTDGSISHSKAGDVEGYRTFNFTWTAPASNQSDVMFDILVNAVNGDNHGPPSPADGVAGGLDHWSRGYLVLPGLPGGGGGAVDISKLGVPLRAYWLGVIGILATMFLLVLSFYVIRSGSKFYEFGLPRGQVKAVKIRTIPPPKNKGAYAVMTALIAIQVLIVVAFLSIRDEDLNALQASSFLLAFVIVLALAAVYYVRAFLPIVDVIEEETVEPLR